MVPGRVVQIDIARSRMRANSFLIIDFKFGCGQTKRKRLNIRSVKAGMPNEDDSMRVNSFQGEQQTQSTAQAVGNNDLRQDEPGAYSVSLQPESTIKSHTNENIDVHGMVWVRAEDGEDQRPVEGTVSKRSFGIRTFTGELIGAVCDYSTRTPIDFFLMIFSPKQLLEMVRLTNRELGKLDLPFTKAGEVLKFIGVLMLCTRCEFGERRSLWYKEPPSKYMPAPNFGKTGMSRSRFDSLFRCLRFSCQPHEREGMSSEKFRWTLVDDFVTRFCEHRISHVIPGDTICVDKSISRWYGQGGDWINHGLSMYVAIDRKPENGCEIQNFACVQSGIMLRLRLVKTVEEEYTHLKETDSDLLHGTVVLKDVISPWAHSVRIVCADSYFASVGAALELKNMGLRFVGVIKTASRHFPMPELGLTEFNTRGESHCLVKKVDGKVQLMAMVWVDRKRRYFILSASSRAPGTPYTIKRWRQIDDRPDVAPERVELTVQSQCSEVYYGSCALIDRHNRCRQGDLSLEKKIGILDLSMRVNMSFLGICIVDTWLAFKNCKGLRCFMKQRDFYNLLTTELIDNNFDVVGSRDRQEVVKESVSVTNGVPRSVIDAHLTPTKRRRTANGVITRNLQQGKCSV